MITIGIETSCDETAVAILDGSDRLLSSEIASQNDVHARFGGIVPEVAARMHAEVINHLLHLALERAGIGHKDISLVAVTVGPGLAVSLVVGISCARALATATGAPIMGVNHLEGHLMSNFLQKPVPELPAVCLLVSGGHTDLILIRSIGRYDYIGRTRDDAAGEAFDKAARLLDLGYPGGPAIQAAALKCEGPAVDFPRPMMFDESFDFSFSGLKTALIYYKKRVEAQSGELKKNETAAGFQDAVVDVLTAKTVRAAEAKGVGTVLLCGGVAANTALRSSLAETCQKKGLSFYSPPFVFCTDNAAMVAKAGYENYIRKSTGFPLSTTQFVTLRCRLLKMCQNQL